MDHLALCNYCVWALNRTSIFEFRPRIQSLATVSHRNRGGRNSMGIMKEKQLGGSGSVSHRNGWDERWLLCTLPHAQGVEQPKKKRPPSFVVRFAHDLRPSASVAPIQPRTYLRRFACPMSAAIATTPRLRRASSRKHGAKSRIADSLAAQRLSTQRREPRRLDGTTLKGRNAAVRVRCSAELVAA